MINLEVGVIVALGNIISQISLMISDFFRIIEEDLLNENRFNVNRQL